MTQMIVHHTIDDFDKWKSVFDEHASERARSGSRSYQLLRASDNPNELLIIFDWDSQDRAENFAESVGLKEAMVQAGVISEPHIHFWEEVESRDESAEAARRSA